MSGNTEKSIRILHISDIHYSKNNENAFEKMVKEPFFDFLKKQKQSKQIDLVCLTGDLINQGTGDFETSEDAFNNVDAKFITPLVELLNLDKQNVLLCPGNHDVNRNLDTDTEKTIKKNLINNIAINKIIDEQRSVEEHSGINRVLPFKKFEEKFYKDNSDSDISLFDSYHKRIVDNKKIGILCLNSAWRYFDKESKIILGKNQILNNLVKIKDNDFNILLSHYRIDKCDDIDTFSENLSTNFNLCCYGHTHSSGSATIIDSINRKSVITVTKGLIPSNWKEENINYINGFSIIDLLISPQDISIVVQPYTYSGAERNTFVLDTETLGKNEPAVYSAPTKTLKIESIFDDKTRKAYSNYLEHFFNIDYNIYIRRSVTEKNEKGNAGTTLEKLKQYRKYVLLANAGMGKSYEAMNLVLDLLNQNDFKDYIPIFLKASSYKKNYQNLEDGIKGQLKPFTQNNTDIFYQDNIQANIILVIDGLDEIIQREHYNSFIEDINTFSAIYPNMFILVTSRENQYHDYLYNFKKMELIPLTNITIHYYLQKNNISASKFNEDYFELFKNPFLLALAVSVYQNNDAFSKFYNKSKFLEQCCLFLAGKRDREKGIEPQVSNYFKLFYNLGKIAYENFDKNVFTELEFDELFGSVFSADEVVEKFRSELFVVGQNFEYKHRLFKEYLIAFYLIKTYPFCNDNLNFYKSIILNENYFEIICFISGLINDIKTQDLFFDFVLQNNLKLFLYTITAKNDLSDSTQELSIDDISQTYLNTFFKTWINIVDLYFPTLKDKFDPQPGIDTEKEICCYGCFSDDRKMFYYWFDRIKSPEKRVFLIPYNEIRNYVFLHEANCKEDKRIATSNSINLDLTRLQGDSARYLAIREIYSNLKRILENHLLIESDYVICEYLNIIKNNFQETKFDSNVDDIFKHFTEKLRKDSFLPNGQRCRISSYYGIDVDTLLYKLQQLKAHNFELNNFPLPTKDQTPQIGYFYEYYSINSIQNYLSDFLFFSEIAYKDMIEKNFNNIKSLFSLYMDIPYRIIYELHTSNNNKYCEGIFYYHEASDAIDRPIQSDNKINSDDLYDEMIKSYSNKSRKLHSFTISSTRIEELIPCGFNDFPFTKYVYNLIQKEIDELFKDFKSF